MATLQNPAKMRHEDVRALTAHPDVILAAGDTWTCSCGANEAWIDGTLLRVLSPHSDHLVVLTYQHPEEPSFAWCRRCGDLARWNPPAPEGAS